MHEIEYFRWLVPPSRPRGKPRLTSYHLTAAEAAQRYPGAVPSPGSRILRNEYDTRDEAHAAKGNLAAGIIAAGGGARRG